MLILHDADGGQYRWRRKRQTQRRRAQDHRLGLRAKKITRRHDALKDERDRASGTYSPSLPFPLPFRLDFLSRTDLVPSPGLPRRLSQSQDWERGRGLDGRLITMMMNADGWLIVDVIEGNEIHRARSRQSRARGHYGSGLFGDAVCPLNSPLHIITYIPCPIPFPTKPVSTNQFVHLRFRPFTTSLIVI